MRQGEDARTTDFIERLAEPVERISISLERHDTHPLASGLEDFARLSLRQPLLADGQAPPAS